MTAQPLQSPRMALSSDGAASRAAGEIGQGAEGPAPPPGQAPEELVHRPPSRVLVMNRIYLEEIEAALAALGVHATAETV